MKHLLLTLLFLPLIACAQSECSPKTMKRTCCDSILKLCRNNGYAMALQSVSDPQSKWYDSLYFPESIVEDFTKALVAWYNDLPDTLADFRWYLQSNKTENAENSGNLLVTLAYRSLDTIVDLTTRSGSKRVDSLMHALGFRFKNVQVMHSLHRVAEWETEKFVNKAYVARKLKAVNPGALLHGSYMKHTDHILQMDYAKNSITIKLKEFLVAPDDDSPLPFILRTFTYRGEEYMVIETSFERGVKLRNGFSDDE